MIQARIMFLLQMWVPLYLEIKYSELRHHHGEFSFDEHEISFSIFLINFCLKSILLDISIATPACFSGPFDWKILSQPFTLM